MSYQQGQQPQAPYGQPPQQPQWQQPPNQPVPQPPKKRGVLKWVLIGVGIVLVAIIGLCAIISVGVGSAVKTATTGTISSTTNNTSGTTSSSNPSTGSGQVAKVGQTITVNNVSCTLVSVQKLAANEYDKPKPGNQFIVVHVKIVNNSSNEQSYNPLFDFHVKSGTGNITNEVFTSSYTANNQLNAGSLAVGGSVEGDIIFQVPIGDHKAELTWQPNFLGNSTDNVWNLGL